MHSNATSILLNLRSMIEIKHILQLRVNFLVLVVKLTRDVVGVVLVQSDGRTQVSLRHLRLGIRHQQLKLSRLRGPRGEALFDLGLVRAETRDT